jgi:hypothetical protein
MARLNKSFKNSSNDTINGLITLIVDCALFHSKAKKSCYTRQMQGLLGYSIFENVQKAYNQVMIVHNKNGQQILNKLLSQNPEGLLCLLILH